MTKTAVLAKTMAGESKSQIAEDLGITRDTVRRILNESELANLVLEGKTGVYMLIPKAVKALEKALDKGDTGEAKIILRSVNILPSEGEGGSAGSAVTINLGAIPRPVHA
jgi:predicted transcriptional regulator